MPVFFEKNIDEYTKLGIWHIQEDESFFLTTVPLQREITHPHKRLQHLAGRFLLKYLFPAFPIELIKIADTRKPFLENEAYHFSISHCGDYAAAIASKKERVGIDIELPSFKVERIENKFLNKEELSMQSSPRSISQLTLMWSCKEAIYKWWSFGSVNFKKNIKLQPFELQPEGSFDADFFSDGISNPLTLHYHIFDELCLAWLKTEL